MKTTLPRWATVTLSVVGIVLLASLALEWISVGSQHVRGYTIAWDEKRWLLLVPVSGALLLATSATRSQHARLAAVLAGVAVAGDVMLELMWGMLRGGAETWLIFGGAAVLIAGMSDKRRVLRALGGVAVLAGFFAPWSSASLFSVLWRAGDVMSAAGFSAKVLWVVPAAGIVGLASAMMSGAWVKRLPVIAGIAVFASFLWFLGATASMFLGWGAWATLGASATALVLGILAPGQPIAASTTALAHAIK